MKTITLSHTSAHSAASEPALEITDEKQTSQTVKVSGNPAIYLFTMQDTIPFVVKSYIKTAG